ncbi:hypothetical protein FJY93_04610 [Candidatus Kaiserbacteria bacterium]|nr:hypothetical protein [Candidatus Kaiserbacteria bacterium]
MPASEKRAHVAVLMLLMSLIGFLGYMWWSGPPQASAPQPIALTSMQETDNVIRKVISCLTDPNMPVGMPFKDISEVNARIEQGGYFIDLMDGIRYFRASGGYMRRAIHCQKSVK